MYNERDQLKLLNSIFKRDRKISIEYLKTDLVSDFSFGSFDSFLFDSDFHDMNVLNKKLIFDEYNEMMNTLNTLKTEFFSQEDSYIPPLKKKIVIQNLKMQAASVTANFNGSYLSRASLIYMKNWENLAQLKKIDISNEINEIKSLNEMITKLNIIVDLSVEVKEIAQNLENIITNFKSDDADPRGISSSYFEAYEAARKDFNDPQKLINKPHMQSLNSLFELYPIVKLFENINENFRKIQLKFVDNGFDFSMAQSYLRELNTADHGDVLSFLFKKSLKIDDIKFTIEMSKSQKYSACTVFEDNSILLKDNNDNLKFVIDDQEASLVIKDIYKSYIDYKLRKKPIIAKFFNELLVKNKYDINNAIVTINTYMDNENILKASEFDILKTANKLLIDENIVFFEDLDDAMNKSILNHKSRQYAHSIVSNKYLALYDDVTYSLLQEIYELGIDKSILQSSIGKKIAAYHNSDELNDSLTKLLNSFNDFNPEAIKLKANSNNINIVVDEKDLIILEVLNFTQSSKLGSASWCISRDEHYFNSYTNDGNKQYFIYDFSKSSKDSNSMIGLTLCSDSTFSTAHLKDDEYQKLNEDLIRIQIRLIVTHPEHFPELSESHKEEYRKLYAPDGTIKPEHAYIFSNKIPNKP